MAQSKRGRFGLYTSADVDGEPWLVLYSDDASGVSLIDGSAAISARQLGPLLTELVQMARDLDVTAPPKPVPQSMIQAMFNDLPPWPSVWSKGGSHAAD